MFPSALKWTRLVKTKTKIVQPRSYRALGSYEIYDDRSLIPKTDDGEFKFVFTLKEKTLIFNLGESAEMPPYVNIPDGSIFN